MSGNMGILGMLIENSKTGKRNSFSFLLAHHVPILGVLKPGVVSVYETDGNTKRYFGMANKRIINRKRFFFSKQWFSSCTSRFKCTIIS
jgi:hypothetical protein